MHTGAPATPGVCTCVLPSTYTGGRRTIKEVVINFTDVPPHRVTLTLHTGVVYHVVAAAPENNLPGSETATTMYFTGSSPVREGAHVCVCWSLLLAAKRMFISRFIHYKARAYCRKPAEHTHTMRNFIPPPPTHVFATFVLHVAIFVVRPYVCVCADAGADA